jgi:Fe-S-cluster-containing hydrogenase component 2
MREGEQHMDKKKSETKEITRREFIVEAGTFLALGTIGGLAIGTSDVVKAADQPSLDGIPVSPLIVHNPNICAGCGVCGLMCAFYHEKEYGHSLARNELVRDPFNAEYTFNVCQQCKSPKCYLACPKKDAALCIDKKTGVKYVNIAECVGCGSCSNACPFTPPRSKVHPAKKVSFKCDLCRGRKEGPVCVEYCTMHALQKVSGKERG